jgi:hypothetical protein
MNIDILAFLRSLSFGGLLGCTIVVLLYVLFPQIFIAPLTFKFMIVFGGLLGAAAHRFIDAIILKGILHPVTRFINFYGKLVQIEQLRRKGIIEPDTYQKIKNDLTIRYFLHEKIEPESSKKLPPKTSD